MPAVIAKEPSGVKAATAGVSAALAAAEMVGAAGLVAVPGVADPGSRRGECGAATGAGSQACTVENYIFVT